MKTLISRKNTVLRAAAIAATVMLALPFTSTVNAQPEHLTILSGSPGGSWYPIAAGITEIFGSEGVPSNAEVGAGLANMARIEKSDAELGMTTSTVPPMARTGKKPFNKPIKDVRAIAAIFPAHQQVGVTRDSGVNSIAELKGRKFNCEAIGNSTQAALVDVLAAAGISEDSLDCTRGSLTFAANAIKDDNIIGLTTLSAYPNGTFSEVFSVVDMRLLPVSKATFKTVKSRNPGYSYSEIPAGTYEGQDQATPTLSSDLILIANKSMPEEEAYWIVKTLLNRIGDLRKVHAAVRPITPKYMAGVTGIKLHPGAARAFKETGIAIGD